ncbi:SGNH/GDSL hydrolase family protein [Microlunatus antarcticus]|uniref:Lysophospholipase L1-like esterase n=1 Tax=Microlunatus antarcticus TaxID=53388 RepID=A0A7W5JVJ0_9ACTN|nr:lysophospholipase L1-like esterase [Microlunatus antarcticus]
MLLIGDSYTKGIGATSKKKAYAYKVAEPLGWDLTIDGKSGTGYIDPSGDGADTYPERMWLRSHNAPDVAYDLVVIQGSSNDRKYTMGEVAGRINLTIRTSRKLWPQAQIILMGPTNPWANVAEYAMVNDKLRAAAAGNGIPFIDPIGEQWFVPGDGERYANVENGHPNDLGYELMARRFVADVKKFSGISGEDGRPHSYWSTTHDSGVADPDDDITWTVLDHKIIASTPDEVVVPFVYTCGTKADPRGVEYDPAAFQTVYADRSAAAYTDLEDPSTGEFPTFTCDGAQHVTEVVLQEQEGDGFETGNIEVGLIKADAGPSVEPTFAHAIIGRDQLLDTRAEVAVTVNATPESTRPGSKITVKGTVKREGKAYKGKDATLYFQTRAGDPAVKIGSATTDSKGNLSTKVIVTGPGTYFWTTTSTSKTQAGVTSRGDYAAAA